MPCMCLAALWPPAGKGAKVVVAGPVGPEYAFGRVPFSRFGSFFFELTSDFIQSCDKLLEHSERCACRQ